MNVVPKAKVNDGKLHFLALKSNPLRLTYGLITSYLKGNKAGTYMSGENIHIFTNENAYFQIGGDLEGKSDDFTFKILPGNLKIRY